MRAHTHGPVNAVIAMTVVAVLMMCSFAVALSGTDGGAVEDGSYTIDMRVDDSFSYEPKTNLMTGTSFEATTVCNGVQNAVFAMNEGGTHLIGIPTESGTYTTTLTANWRGDGLSQSARQIITFNVYDRITFSGAPGYGDHTVTRGLLTSVQNGQEVFAATFSDISYGQVFDDGAWNILYREDTSSVDVQSDDLVVKLDEGHHTARISSGVDSLRAGIYTVTLPASYSVGPGDNATLTVKLIVAEDISILTDSISAYIGEDQGTKRLEIAYDIPDGAEEPVFTIVEQDSEGIVSVDGKYIVIDTSGITNDDIGDDRDSMELAFTLRAESSVIPEGMTEEDRLQLTDEKLVTLTMYKNFRFTTEPEFSRAVNTYPASGNNLSVLVTATVLGATHISYDWGDGSSDSSTFSVKDGSVLLTLDHVYKEAKKYLIRVTAYNDVGDRSMYILYDASTGESGTATEERPDDGSDERSFMAFVVSTLLSAIGAVSFIFFGYRHPLMVAIAMVSAVLAVYFLVADDVIGYIADGLGRLFG